MALPTPVCTPQLGSQHPRCPQPTGRENLTGNSVSGQFWLTRCHQAETCINRPVSFLRAEARQGGCQGPQLGPSAWFLLGETHLAWVPGPPGPRSGVPGVCRGGWGGCSAAPGWTVSFFPSLVSHKHPAVLRALVKGSRHFPGPASSQGLTQRQGCTPAHGALGLAGGQPAHQ